MVRDPVILSHKPLLNGDFEFLGRQYRSSSEVSEVPCVERIRPGYRLFAYSNLWCGFGNTTSFYKYAVLLPFEYVSFKLTP